MSNPPILPRLYSALIYCSCSSILIDEGGRPRPKAHCVVFQDASGRSHKACLIKSFGNSEIILSAGAIGSPQLLMLSGVGSAKQLRQHGIDVVVDQPLVGQGMADNPMNALFIPSPLPVEVSLIQVVGITRFDSYIETASGLSFAYSWAQRLSADYELFSNQVFYELFLQPVDFVYFIFFKITCFTPKI